jgi:hypothetical protein
MLKTPLGLVFVCRREGEVGRRENEGRGGRRRKKEGRRENNCTNLPGSFSCECNVGRRYWSL